MQCCCYGSQCESLEDFILFFHIFLPLTSVYMLVLLQREAQDCSPCKTSVLVIDLKEVRNGLGRMTVTKHHTADNKPTAKFKEWVFSMASISGLQRNAQPDFARDHSAAESWKSHCTQWGMGGGLHGVTNGSMEGLQGMNGSERPELLRCQ